jgi:hypothetical protein
MPYIKPEAREKYDKLIKTLAQELTRPVGGVVDGEVNYVISRLINLSYERRYASLNRAIGVLECIKQEYYRRVVAPYEDEKIKENGDVY